VTAVVGATVVARHAGEMILELRGSPRATRQGGNPAAPAGPSVAARKRDYRSGAAKVRPVFGKKSAGSGARKTTTLLGDVAHFAIC
jgi:hypothetical protein